MPYRYAYFKLRGGCYECDNIENLQMCEFCKVTRYCPEHKDSHNRRDEDGMSCRSITWARKQVEVTLKKVQDQVGPEIDPVDLPLQHPLARLQSHVLYREACRHCATALKVITTRQSLEEQVKSFQGWRKYNLLWNDIILPSTLIRLNRDEEAWEIIKKDITYYLFFQMMLDLAPNSNLWVAAGATGAWDNPNLLFHSSRCQFNVLATVIKIRMLLDIQCVESARDPMGRKVPQEVLAHVLTHVPVTQIIAQDRNLAYDDHEAKKETLRGQIEWMFLGVHRACSDIWYYVLHGALPSIRSCTCKPETLFRGDRCIWDDLLPRITLRAPWTESPGSLEYLESLINEHTMLLDL